MRTLNKHKNSSDDMDVDIATLREEHDDLLANQPEGSTHDAASCPYCNDSLSGDEHASEGGVMATYTDEDLQTAVAEAVSPLHAKIAAFEASTEKAEIDAKIAEVTAELTAQITELQTQLDAAVLEAEAAKKEYASLVEALESAKAEEEAAVELAARRDERLKTVREAASFPEAYLEKNADRWAAMDEEAFMMAVEDWRQFSGKESAERVPAETAMAGVAASKSSSEGKALMREMFDNTIRGIDPRKV